MISRADIKKILDAGVQAPSGDNSQPWRFEVSDNCISIYNLPGKDNPVLNYEQRGSYIAHGALVENIVIASMKFGYTATVRSFPDHRDRTLTARIVLSAKQAVPDPLAAFILRRHTNRRPYEDAPLVSYERNALRASVNHFNASQNISFAFIADPQLKWSLAAASSSIEEVILENRELHKLFFSDIVWTEKKERKIRSGLFVATMEFILPQKIIFWLASHWPIIKVLNVFGLSRFIAREDTKLYATGAGFGVLLLKNSQAEDFLLAGRAMQRLWLTATSLDLSIQPIVALVFAAMRINSDIDNYFSPGHVAIIKSNYNIVQGILNAPRQTVAMLFRIGHADSPSAFSSRKHPDIVFK